MGKMGKIIIAIIIVGVVAGGAILLMRKEPTAKQQSKGQPSAVTIAYGQNGFSPSTLAVAAGSTITFKNETDEEIEPSSNPHPVHTDNSELNVGDIEPGQSKTITVRAKGVWGFHNHYKDSDTATITVE